AAVYAKDSGCQNCRRKSKSCCFFHCFSPLFSLHEFHTNVLLFLHYTHFGIYVHRFHSFFIFFRGYFRILPGRRRPIQPAPRRRSRTDPMKTPSSSLMPDGGKIIYMRIIPENNRSCPPDNISCLPEGAFPDEPSVPGSGGDVRY